MYNKKYCSGLWFCLAIWALLFSGCAPEIHRPAAVVPSKESAAEALSALKARSAKAVPLLARGRCVFEYYEAESENRKKEQLDVVILMKPPVKLYMQGDATLVPKALILGSNEREFWLIMRPKEISTYWWGLWSEQDSSEGLMINPRTLFEAIGFLETGKQDDWSLSREGTFDVLTKRRSGIVVKRIHVSKYGYLVGKIEYFDSQGRALASAELKNYKEVSEGFYVPSWIQITAYKQEDKAEPLSITLDLSTIKPREFTEKLERVFERPPPGNLKHILKKEGDKWVEQNQ
jgi:hypothetical protein